MLVLQIVVAGILMVVTVELTGWIACKFTDFANREPGDGQCTD